MAFHIHLTGHRLHSHGFDQCWPGNSANDFYESTEKFNKYTVFIQYFLPSRNVRSDRHVDIDLDVVAESQSKDLLVASDHCPQSTHSLPHE